MMLSEKQISWLVDQGHKIGESRYAPFAVLLGKKEWRERAHGQSDIGLLVLSGDLDDELNLPEGVRLLALPERKTEGE